MLDNGCMFNLVDTQLLLATISYKFSSCYCFTHVSFLVGGGIAVLRWWCDDGESVGDMVRSWYVASRELLLRRFEAFFGVVPQLPFNVRVDNLCLNVNPHVSVEV